MALWNGPERLIPCEAPQSDVGAPLPHIMADDCHFVFAYLVHRPDPDVGGTHVDVVSASDTDLCAIVVAKNFDSLSFGAPNDEAMAGHRLERLGIRPYSSYELQNSSWIEALEKANSIHAHHDRNRFEKLRHFIFTFHDTTLEFVAQNVSFELKMGQVRRLLVDAFERVSSV